MHSIQLYITPGGNSYFTIEYFEVLQNIHNFTMSDCMIEMLEQKDTQPSIV